jgi:hypothetical protein
MMEKAAMGFHKDPEDSHQKVDGMDSGSQALKPKELFRHFQII